MGYFVNRSNITSIELISQVYGVRDVVSSFNESPPFDLNNVELRIHYTVIDIQSIDVHIHMIFDV